jgi:large subunit ribosomal protein L21
MDSYAIIRLGNKQHRVRDGETLVVDRLSTEAGKSFEPDVLLGEGKVTATVLAHERGPKIRIGKYRRRTGYKKHTGYRSRLTRIEIESIGAAKRAKAAAKPKAEVAEPKSAAAPAPKEQTESALPEGYAAMTIAQLTEAAGSWSREQVEAALEHEGSGKARKGALAALESALEEK